MSTTTPTTTLNGLDDRYERLRRRMTDGAQGPEDDLSVLHQRGLHAWVVHVTTPPPPRAIARAAPAGGSIALAARRSPLVGLCTDMLLATLNR